MTNMKTYTNFYHIFFKVNFNQLSVAVLSYDAYFIPKALYAP